MLEPLNIVRQGYPLSSLLYVLAILALLHNLKTVSDISCGRGVVSAYVDEFPVIVSDDKNIHIVSATVKKYKEATRANINPVKQAVLQICT